MTGPGLGYETYRTGDRDEWMMLIGAPDGLPILFVPPLLEEMNRTRALLAAAMRSLAAAGHGCWLPDLAGTGESEVSLSGIRFEDWRHDVRMAAAHVAERSGRRPVIASTRGGCLVDDAAEAAGWWRFAPVLGKSLARDMERAGIAGTPWAGYSPSEDLKTELAAAEPRRVSRLRTVRLASDAAEADARLAGPALWRRSEPGRSNELAAAMAADLETWSRACAAS